MPILTDRVEQAVIRLVAEMAGIDGREVVLTTQPIDFGLDSMQVLDLAGKLENEFSVHIPDEALAEMSDLADLVRFVSEQGGEN